MQNVKKSITILLAITFFLQGTSSVWIMLSFYVQRDYISKTLCVNRFDAIPVCKGQCYLKKQIKENDNKDRSTETLKLKEIILFVQANEFTSTVNTVFSLCTDDFFVKEDQCNSSSPITAIFHPPCKA